MITVQWLLCAAAWTATAVAVLTIADRIAARSEQDEARRADVAAAHRLAADLAFDEHVESTVHLTTWDDEYAALCAREENR